MNFSLYTTINIVLPQTLLPKCLRKPHKPQIRRKRIRFGKCVESIYYMHIFSIFKSFKGVPAGTNSDAREETRVSTSYCPTWSNSLVPRELLASVRRQSKHCSKCVSISYNWLRVMIDDLNTLWSREFCLSTLVVLSASLLIMCGNAFQSLLCIFTLHNVIRLRALLINSALIRGASYLNIVLHTRLCSFSSCSPSLMQSYHLH